MAPTRSGTVTTYRSSWNANNRSPSFISEPNERVVTRKEKEKKTNKGTPEKPIVRARWIAQEYKWRTGLDCEHYAPTLGLDLVSGELSHAAAARKNKDHVVAVVEVRRAYFYAEPLPKTFVNTRTRCYGTRQAARSWQREIEQGVKAAGLVMEEMSKCSFTSPCGKLVSRVTSCPSLVDAVRNSPRKRHEIREQMLGAGPKNANEIIMLNRRVQWRGKHSDITRPSTCEGTSLRNWVWREPNLQTRQ